MLTPSCAEAVANRIAAAGPVSGGRTETAPIPRGPASSFVPFGFRGPGNTRHARPKKATSGFPQQSVDALVCLRRLVCVGPNTHTHHHPHVEFSGMRVLATMRRQKQA